jgi:translation elongation factor EF-Tu-like GTPase
MSDKLSIPGEGKLVGKVTHYYNNIGVSIIKLSAVLKVGDSIRIIGGEVDFEQVVESIEIEHKKVKTAKVGEVIGLMVGEKVREGYKVYKV